MKKYVEKNIIERAISVYLFGIQKDAVEAAHEIVSNVEAIDAESVIRCENCKYYTQQENIHRCGLTNYVVRQDDYCSYAEEEYLKYRVEKLQSESKELKETVSTDVSMFSLPNR